MTRTACLPGAKLAQFALRMETGRPFRYSSYDTTFSYTKMQSYTIGMVQLEVGVNPTIASRPALLFGSEQRRWMPFSASTLPVQRTTALCPPHHPPGFTGPIRESIGPRCVRTPRRLFAGARYTRRICGSSAPKVQNGSSSAAFDKSKQARKFECVPPTVIPAATAVRNPAPQNANQGCPKLLRKGKPWPPLQ